jgi:hypothetical protein
VVPGEPVTIRKLSGGPDRAGSLHDSERNLLRLRLEPDAEPAKFSAADLVEIACPQTLYLGEVQGREDGLLIVSVEHSVDRATLSAIQQVWYRPENE